MVYSIMDKKPLRLMESFVKLIKKITQPQYRIILYLILYFLINLTFLRDFPYVHSDESWLSGLSRNILMTGDLKVTEPFFDVYDRNPHAIRLLFHLLQAAFTKIFGYHIFSFRLISLFFSIASLGLFYQLAKIVLKSQKLALFTTILLSLDLQYLYASHLARQEIIILFALIFAVFLVFKGIDHHHYGQDIKIGLIIGLSIGLHPNSFIIAITIGLVYLFYLHNHKLRPKNLLVLMATVGFFALVFIGISLYMDPLYLSHYFEHGQNFGIFNGLLNKGANFFAFYKNIFLGTSSEYYLPQIIFQLLFFALVFLVSLIYGLQKQAKPSLLYLKPLVSIVLGINAGIFLIGRFNVTSIILIFPFMYLLSILWLQELDKKRLAAGLLMLIVFINTLLFMPRYASTYDHYLQAISKSIASDSRVFANLNSEYLFENGHFFAYRNLQYLQYHDLPFADYIRSRDIDYILYYGELDYIVANNPSYNNMYGDLSNVLPEMKAFLETDCQEIDRFSNATYGTKLANQIDRKDWPMIIYQVTPD